MSQAVARVWASDLESIALGDAIPAASLHYQESTDWLLPAHVIRNVKRARRVALPLRAVEAASRECSEHAGYPLPCHRCEEGS